MTEKESSRQLPRLSRDRAFYGMTVTQFLGAFNDNLFKQLVLLICLDYKGTVEGDYQSLAQAIFAIPFILFSGFAGFLSDRSSKRSIIILCKVGEIFVMLAGLVAFLLGAISPTTLLVSVMIVLFFMSTQSAFFGPSKYGILPEMFRDDDLPTANGIIQMTTFVAIIFGMALAGFAKEQFQDKLWIVSLICIGIAILGTLTSFFVRKTRVANPGLKFDKSALGIKRETWDMIRHDRPLLGVLLVSSLFWFIGGVIIPSVNSFAKIQLNFGDSRTSFMAACMGIGIAIGCVVAGKSSHHRVNFRVTIVGAWGLILCLLGISILGTMVDPVTEAVAELRAANPESMSELFFSKYDGELIGRLLLMVAGFFAGLFIVPLQVFMQARPPEDQKGRMIGAMNLINWIGIILAAGFYAAVATLCSSVGILGSWIFIAIAVVLLPVALFYRPKDAELTHASPDS